MGKIHRIWVSEDFYKYMKDLSKRKGINIIDTSKMLNEKLKNESYKNKQKKWFEL